MAYVSFISASSSLSRMQRDEAHKECAKLLKLEVCVDAVAAASGDQGAVERLKSEIEKEVPEAHPLLDVADGKTLVEVLTPILPAAQLAIMLLAVAEGRTNAVMLHGLWGSAKFKEPPSQRLFRAVCENYGDLTSEGYRMALLKLYYLH